MFSSSLEYSDNDNDPAFVYYNIDIISNKTNESGLGEDPVVQYSETRQQPIISDASKYYFSIIRASIDGAGSGLPLFIPSIQTGQSDINLTVYSVTIFFKCQGVNGSSNQSYISYESEAINPILPNPPTSKQDYSGKYYYVFSYSHWLTLVNNAIQQAWQFAVNEITSFGKVVNTKCPQMIYDPITGLFSMYCDSYGFGSDRTSAGTETDESFSIYFNSPMYQLFRNFHFNFHGGEPTNYGLTYELVVNNKLDKNVYTDSKGTKYYVMTQDFPSTDSIWSPITSLVFTTSLLCTLPEQVGVPIKYTDGNNYFQTSASNFSNVITDIALPLTKASDYKGFIQYTANPYRFISMSNSSQDVRSVDIRLFWKNKLDNELYPVTMSGLSNVSIKMLFKRKDCTF
jgi:hypothetical protein